MSQNHHISIPFFIATFNNYCTTKNNRPGKADTVTLDIAPIKMTNLGSDSKLDAGILSAKIMLAIAEGVTEQGVGVLPEEIIGTMQSTLKRTVDLGKAATKEAEKILDVGKDALDIFKGLTKPK